MLRARPLARPDIRAERNAGERSPGGAGQDEHGRPRLCADQVVGLCRRPHRLLRRCPVRRRRRPGVRNARRHRPCPVEDTGPLQLRRLPRLLLQAARRRRRQARERALGDGRRRQAERRRIPVRAARPGIARPLQPRFHRQLGRRARQSEAALDLAGQAGLPGAGGGVLGSDVAAAAIAGIDQGRDGADAGAGRAGRGRRRCCGVDHG